MTANQLRYWELEEAKRSNKAKEDETVRSNLAREQETKRHNVVTEITKGVEVGAKVLKGAQPLINAFI